MAAGDEGSGMVRKSGIHHARVNWSQAASARRERCTRQGDSAAQSVRMHLRHTQSSAHTAQTTHRSTPEQWMVGAWWREEQAGETQTT